MISLSKLIVVLTLQGYNLSFEKTTEGIRVVSSRDGKTRVYMTSKESLDSLMDTDSFFKLVLRELTG